MKKFVLTFFIVMILATSLFAQSVTEATKDEDEIVHLNFVEILPTEERTILLKQVIENYEKDHPNVEIELITFSEDEAYEGLSSMIKEGTADICEVRDRSVAKFIEEDLYYNLDDLIGEWSNSVQLIDAALEVSSSIGEGCTYFIPLYLYVKALIVRTDILAQYGLTAPTTMDEFRAVCSTLVAQGNGQYAFALKGTTPCRIMDVLFCSYIDNIDPDNIYLTTDGHFYLDTDGGRAALEAYVRLYKNYCPPESIDWTFSDQIQGFVSGQTPLLVQDSDAIMLIDQYLDESQYQVVPIPVGTTGKRYLDQGFAGLAVASTSKYPEEAFEFIKYMVSANINTQICEFYGALPVNKQAYYLSDTFKNEDYKVGIEQLTYEDTVLMRFPLDDSRFLGYQKVHETAIKELLLGNATVEETIQTLKEYWGY